MATDRVLSQDSIDGVFRIVQDSGVEEETSRRTQSYDFRRPDRIAKDQIRAIHLLHENFARGLASSLSAYLRAYIMVNLVSVEQLSFREFTQCLPSPTCMVSLAMKPLEGSAVLELNPALVFPIVEMLLGGSGRNPSKITREITEIEQCIMDGILRIILQNLRAAWHSVTTLDFTIDTRETEPALLQILAPNEALVAISLEIRVGDNSGMMNIGIPSIFIKMLRQKFDQQWSVRKTEVTEDEHLRMLRLIKPAAIHVDARLQGPSLEVEDLMKLEVGDVITFDHPATRPLDLIVNGKLKYKGYPVSTGKNKGFSVQQLYTQSG